MRGSGGMGHILTEGATRKHGGGAPDARRTAQNRQWGRSATALPDRGQGRSWGAVAYLHMHLCMHVCVVYVRKMVGCESALEHMPSRVFAHAFQ
eukprot:1159570-Pelagomonas_calceolata.AAC.4